MCNFCGLMAKVNPRWVMGYLDLILSQIFGKKRLTFKPKNPIQTNEFRLASYERLYQRMLVF